MTLLDTHALAWWLVDPERLTVRARRAIHSASQARRLAVSAVSIFEIATLVRRGRLVMPGGLAPWLADLRSLPELSIEPVTAEIGALAGSLEESIQGDPIDRLILATAQSLQAPLISADARMKQAALVPVIW